MSRQILSCAHDYLVHMQCTGPSSPRAMSWRLAAALLTATVCLQACLNTYLFKADHPIQPGQVRVSLDVVKELDLSEGSVRTSLEARFFDGDDQRIPLEHGAVYVNDQRMNRHTALLLQFYRLSGGGMAFVHDTTYVFRIVLDSTSGVAYICSVRTPRGDLTNASVFTFSDTAAVTWSGDTTLPLRLHYRLTRGTTDSTRESLTKDSTFMPPHASSLQVSLEGYDAFHLDRLETVTPGFVDPAFRGGTIEALVRVIP